MFGGIPFRILEQFYVGTKSGQQSAYLKSYTLWSGHDSVGKDKVVFLSFSLNMFTAEVHMESLIALLAGERGFIKVKTTSNRCRAVTRQWEGVELITTTPILLSIIRLWEVNSSSRWPRWIWLFCSTVLDLERKKSCPIRCRGPALILPNTSYMYLLCLVTCLRMVYWNQHLCACHCNYIADASFTSPWNKHLWA